MKRVKEYLPEYFEFISQCYTEKTILSNGTDQILSQRGAQQGDPLGPPLFCLVIHPLISSLNSEMNLWYLDDGCLTGDVNSIIENFEKIIALSADLGLKLNFGKCEISITSENPKPILFQNLSILIKI